MLLPEQRSWGGSNVEAFDGFVYFGILLASALSLRPPAVAASSPREFVLDTQIKNPVELMEVNARSAGMGLTDYLQARLKNLPQFGISEGTVDGVRADTLRDLLFFARQDGRNPAAVITEHYQDPLVNELGSTLAPQGLVEIARTDGAKTVVATFSGVAPATALTELRRLSGRVIIREGVGFTRADIDRSVGEMRSALGRTSEAIIAPDYLSGRIKVYAPDESSIVQARVAIGRIGGRIQVDVVRDLGVGSAPEDMIARGGGLLDSAGCTTAFVLRSLSGRTYRHLTAWHCVITGSASTYRLHSVNGSTAVTVSLLRETSTREDVGTTTLGGMTPNPAFYYGWSTGRYARSALNPRPGTAICKFGRTTGSTCGTVWATGRSTASYDNLTVADRYMSSPGDSGGPWFSGSNAGGAHHGWTTYSGRKVSAFTPTYFVQNMGYQVHVWS